MNRIISLLSIVALLVLANCDKTESPQPDVQEFGYLSLNVGIQIDELTAGRVEAVSADNFLVTIHDASDGSEVLRFDTYLEVPEEVQLPTGSYFVRATNLEFPEDAAFEQPWYFGESDVFTIDKEELNAVDVTCTLANCKISFNYLPSVQDDFTNWNATATIDDGAGTGAFLQWIQNDAAEGYFLTDNPIDIEVYLEYVKLTNPDEKITRTFNATIEAPSPATHYLINVDASLEDGKIVINLTVDDSFQTQEINLGEVIVDPDDPNADWTAGTPWIDVRDGNSYETVQIGDQVWFAEDLRAIDLNDGTPIGNVTDPAGWGGLSTPGYAWYDNVDQSGSGYGRLYNWYVVETGLACPVGWHVPNNTEWTTLINFAGGASIAGNKLKEAGTSHWVNNNSQVTNELGFTSLPAGWRTADGSFFDLGLVNYSWSSVATSGSNSSFHAFINNSGAVSMISSSKKLGLSVRCLKD